MSTHKRIDQICVAAIVSAVIICILFMNGAALGIQSMTQTKGYETSLFDTSKVHTIDIEMDDWDDFIADCEDEEYVSCTVVIDNHSCKNVGIRAKGNTSLTTVSQMNSDRYSFKIEFDHYQDGKNYYGLDKLSLNNIIQDNTYMKDYLCYQMMNAFDVDAPLCSYVWITVNGEAWGLYLAVEGIEDSFLERNYGSEDGQLYKPDTMNQGGGRGNGKEFDMDDFDPEEEKTDQSSNAAQEKSTGQKSTQNTASPRNADSSGTMQMPQMPENMEMPDNAGEMPDFSSGGNMQDMGNQPGGNGGGMGSDDVKLRYIDDNVTSYSNIFNNAKINASTADQQRLIASLKSLSQNENLEEVVNVDEVIRYFVVHNFVVNGDSYTGSMVHNYYLYENDGQLSMIPWDYNLAFGGFGSGNASSVVNDAIDTPLSVSSSDDRPMFTWITKNENYLQQYHEYYADFLESVDIQGMIDQAYGLIADYVNQDPTKFCTTQEFETGVQTLKNFCSLRTQSITGQLNGTIPSTDEGQSADSSKLVDASSITLSDMGNQNAGGVMGEQGQQIPGNAENSGTGETAPAMPENAQDMPQMPSGNSMQTPPSGTNNNGTDSSNEEQINQDTGKMPQQFSGGNQNSDGSGMQDGEKQTQQSQSQTKPSAENTTASGSTGVLLLLSAVLLAAGLVFAFKVK